MICFWRDHGLLIYCTRDLGQRASSQPKMSRVFGVDHFATGNMAERPKLISQCWRWYISSVAFVDIQYGGVTLCHSAMQSNMAACICI